YCLCLHFLSLPAVHFPLTCPPITAICTLSLHDALPISARSRSRMRSRASRRRPAVPRHARAASRAAVCSRSRTQCIEEAGERREDRKSTRLNSSHVKISYAVFCLKKKKKT